MNPTERRLVEALATHYADRDSARVAYAEASDGEREAPPFTTADDFWRTVVLQASHGAAPTLERLIAQLAKLDPRPPVVSALAAALARPQARRVAVVHAVPAAERFHDRPELDELRRWWADEEPRVAVLVGSGGAGKSALAAELWRRLEGGNWPPDAEGLFCYSLSVAPDPRACLERLATWLGPSPTAGPATVEVVVRRLQDWQGRLLVLLDGLEDAERSGAAFADLQGILGLVANGSFAPGVRVLLTARPSALDALPPDRRLIRCEVVSERLSLELQDRARVQAGLAPLPRDVAAARASESRHALTAIMSAFEEGPPAAAAPDGADPHGRRWDGALDALSARDPLAAEAIEHASLYRFGVSPGRLRQQLHDALGAERMAAAGPTVGALLEGTLPLAALADGRLVVCQALRRHLEERRTRRPHLRYREVLGRMAILHSQRERLTSPATAVAPAAAVELDELEELLFQAAQAGEWTLAWNIYLHGFGGYQRIIHDWSCPARGARLTGVLHETAPAEGPAMSAPAAPPAPGARPRPLVFVAYADADRERAERDWLPLVREQLVSVGASVFSPADVATGEVLEVRCRERMAAAAAVVLLVTPALLGDPLRVQALALRARGVPVLALPARVCLERALRDHGLAPGTRGEVTAAPWDRPLEALMKEPHLAAEAAARLAARVLEVTDRPAVGADDPVSRAMNDRAGFARQLGELVQARAHYAAALARARERQADEDVWIARRSLLHLDLLTGRLASVVREADRVLGELGAREDAHARKTRAVVHATRAEAHRARGEQEAARRAFEDGLASDAPEVGPALLSITRLWYADALVEFGELERAETMLEGVRAVARGSRLLTRWCELVEARGLLRRARDLAPGPSDPSARRRRAALARAADLLDEFGAWVSGTGDAWAWLEEQVTRAHLLRLAVALEGGLPNEGMRPALDALDRAIDRACSYGFALHLFDLLLVRAELGAPHLLDVLLDAGARSSFVPPGGRPPPTPLPDLTECSYRRPEAERLRERLRTGG